MRRIGRVHISTEIVKDNPALYFSIMAEAIVWRCEHRPEMVAFEYVAEHPAFDKIECGPKTAYKIPTYFANMEMVTTEEGELGQTKTIFNNFQRLNDG